MIVINRTAATVGVLLWILALLLALQVDDALWATLSCSGAGASWWLFVYVWGTP